MRNDTKLLREAGFRPGEETGLPFIDAQQEARRLYQKDPSRWKGELQKGIEEVGVAWADASGKPLVTTEGWALVDYKDAPRWNWDWIKDLCGFGVETASRTGRWAALCTSNFCAPQFVGMWSDVKWHREMTDIIHSGTLPKPIAANTSRL